MYVEYAWNNPGRRRNIFDEEAPFGISPENFIGNIRNLLQEAAIYPDRVGRLGITRVNQNAYLINTGILAHTLDIMRPDIIKLLKACRMQRDDHVRRYCNATYNLPDRRNWKMWRGFSFGEPRQPLGKPAQRFPLEPQISSDSSD
jgi:hypothetical protein